MASHGHETSTPVVPEEELTPEQEDLVNAMWTRPRGLEEQMGAPMRGSLTQAFGTPSKSDLGLLQVFALETMTAVVNELDLQSCVRLRQVNRLFRQVVTSAPKYRLVVENALNLLRCTLRGKLGSLRTLRDVESLLGQKYCCCGQNFGNMVDPLRWKKMCLSCFYDKGIGNKCISRDKAALALGITTSRLSKLVPVMERAGAHHAQRAHYVVTTASISQLATQIKSSRSAEGIHESLVRAPNNMVPSQLVPYVDEKGRVVWGGSCSGSNLYKQCPGSFTAKGYYDHIHRCKMARLRMRKLRKFAETLELEDGWVWIRKD